MNKKLVKCIECGMVFAIVGYSNITFLEKCDKHWHCEHQEHIETQTYYPNYSTRASSAVSATTTTTTLPPA